MRTLILAERPFRDLLSRALLAEAAGAIAHAAPMLVATAAPSVPAGFAPAAPGEVPAGVARVVMAGAFLERRKLEEALATAERALAAGARLEIHALSLEAEAARIEAPSGAAALARAARITVRDHRTLNVLTLWRAAGGAIITPYPERLVEADAALAASLPPGPILGISLRGGEEMRRSWTPRLPAIRRLLARAEGWAVLPLGTQTPGTPGDDAEGSAEFIAAALPGARVLLPELADPATFRRRMTPARLKGLVARCALLLTNRDLPACYAVASGVQVLGLALGADRRIISCLATLANDLPAGSLLAHPVPGP